MVIAFTARQEHPARELGQMSVRDDETLTKTEARKLAGADSRNNPYSDQNKASNTSQDHPIRLPGPDLADVKQILIEQEQTITDRIHQLKQSKALSLYGQLQIALYKQEQADTAYEDNMANAADKQ